MDTQGHNSILIYMVNILLCMSKYTLEMGKKMTFVAKYSPQGKKIIIIVPKVEHDSIQKLKNPLKVTIEEIID